MNQPAKSVNDGVEQKKAELRPTTCVEKVITVIIMVAGVTICLTLLGSMIFYKYQFDIKLFLASLFTGPGALYWGLSNYRVSKFWDSYYGKRLKGQSVK